MRRQAAPTAAAQRPPSIVFLVPGFPESEDDTTCLPAVQNYIAAYGASRPDVEVHVLAFQYPFRRGSYRWNGVTVHALGGENRRGLKRLATWRRAALAFRRLRRSTDVRVLHSFWLTECARVGVWLSRRDRVRHVASIGGQDARPENPYLRYLDLDGLVLTAGSTFAADVFSRHAGRTVDHVIPLGLDTAHLASIDAPAERDIDLLGVGSLTPLKDYATFLDVVAALASDVPGLRACIIGEGPELGALRRRIVRQRLDRNVVLAGQLPRDEVFRHMLRSKVFLHASRYESQGYVFLEALFAGLPVVCFDVGYAADSDHVLRCRSRGEMMAATADLLRNPRPLGRQPVPCVQDTVGVFDAIYNGA